MKMRGGKHLTRKWKPEPMKRFDGKVAVVTGGARGIGLATARQLAREGGAVAFVDMDGDRAKEVADSVAKEHGTRTLAVPANIAKLEDVRRAHETIASGLGAPDILINCAAIADDKLFLDSTPADWDRILSVDLYGALNTLHTFLPQMVERNKGRVVYLASDASAAIEGAVLVAE